MMRERHLERESGSAYIITLLLLVVLTLLGLSLALVTGTESQIGTNERVLERTYYATDAGIGIAAARILAGGDYNYDVNDDVNNSYIMNEADDAPALLSQSRVSVGPLVTLYSGPCNLCEINNATATNNKAKTRLNVLIPARGSRQTLANATAERRVAATIDMQPAEGNVSSAFPLEFLTLEQLAEKATL